MDDKAEEIIYNLAQELSIYHLSFFGRLACGLGARETWRRRSFFLVGARLKGREREELVT